MRPYADGSLFLSIREVAAALHCNAEVIRRDIRKGVVPAVRRGVKWLVPVAYLHDLEREAFAHVRK